MMKTEVIVAVISGVAALLGIIAKGILSLLNHRINVKRSEQEGRAKKAQKKSYSLTSALKKNLDLQRAKWQASRLYVSLLHNGTNYGIAGLHYERLTVAFESTDHITRSAYGVIRNYPVLQFSPLIEVLHEDGKHHRSLHEEPKESESRASMEQNAIEDEFLVPIKDKRGVIVGIVGVTYHTRRFKEAHGRDWSDGDWDVLNGLATHVTDALTAVVDAGGSGIIN